MLDQERYADALFRIIQFRESCRSIFSNSAMSEADRRCQACRNAKDLIENRVFYNPDTKLDLAKVRNQAIHTPGGVSRAIIENTVRGYVPEGSDSEPLEYLKNLLEEIIDSLYACFDQTRSENPYPILQKEMLSLLDQEAEL